jgi:hypothetical protein
MPAFSRDAVDVVPRNSLVVASIEVSRDKRLHHVRRVEPPAEPDLDHRDLDTIRANHSKAMSVANSKWVSARPAASSAVRSAATRRTTSASGIVWPPARMRSVKSTRCGDV